MATIKKPQAPGVPADTRVDNKPAPPVDEVEQAALDAQNNGGDMPPAGYKYGDTIDSSTGKPELIKSPVINTNNVRNKAQENAKLVEDKAGTKKVISTVTSNGKITKTYSDGTTEVTESGISGETGTPDRRQILDEQKNIYTDQEKLQADVAQRYDNLKVSQDEAYNQLVENTKNQFASLRTKLTDSNRRFEMRTAQGQYLNNGFRYTPQSSEGMVYQAEQAGIARLSELNLQESIALQKALAAKNDSDYQGLQKYTSDIRAIQQDRMNTLDKMNTQIKNIEDTDKNIRNMNENEAAVMNSMIDYYILSQKTMSAKETDEFYDKKSKELSELMGFTVAPEFIKAQVEGGSIAAKTEINEPLSVANGYYTDKLGRPITDNEGKNIPLEKEDWFQEIIGNTLSVGTYDDDGNRVIKEYKLKGETKTYKETLEELPPTQTNITAQTLAKTFTGPMADLIVQNNARIPTTVAAFKNLQGGGMQCAEYVNRVMGTSFGDTIENKLSKATDKTGQVGSAAVWDAGDSEHGHVGVIMADNGDTWTIRSSNIHGDTMVTTDIVPKSAIKGYYTSEAVKKMTPAQQGQYDPIADKNLTQVGNSTEGGLFYDNKTGKTITGNEAKTLYGQTTQGGTTTGTGIGQDLTLRSIAIGQIAFGKNVSDTEGAKIEKIVTKYPNATNQEIALLVKNMVINDPKNTEKALQYLDVFKNMKTPPAGFEAQIANLINKGDIAGLDAYVEANIERAVKEDTPADEFISSSSYKTGLETTNRLIGLLEDNKDQVGPFEGNINKWKSKFKNTPIYNEINTLLQMTQAERRKTFAGSAVTETEMKALENFIGGTATMTPEKLITMLQTVQQKTTSQYNNQRALYRKPDVNNTYSAPTQTTGGQSTSSQPTGNWFDN